MSKRYSGKSFKDSSTAKKPKLSLKEKRKNKIKIPKNTFEKIITFILWLIFIPIGILFKLCFFIISRVIKIILLIDKKIK